MTKPTHAIVPVEPTEEMLKAMAGAYDAGWGYPNPQSVEARWAKKSQVAMLEASPNAGKVSREQLTKIAEIIYENQGLSVMSARVVAAHVAKSLGLSIEGEEE